MFNIVLEHGATIPEKGSLLAVGADLKVKGYSLVKENDKGEREIQKPVWFDESNEKEVIIEPHTTVLLKSGIKIQPIEISKEDADWILDFNIRPKSGLSLKYGVGAWYGSAEEDYTGDYGIIFINTTNKPYIVRENDKVGQLVVSACVNLTPDKFNIVTELQTTGRGSGAYGSTGK